MKTNTFKAKNSWKNTALQATGVVTGVAVAGAIKKAITKETLSGLGLGNSTVSNYVVPGILTVIGIAGVAMMNDKFAQSAALGVTAVGTAGIVNEFAGKPVIALGSAENKLLPGMGNASLHIPQTYRPLKRIR